MKNLLRKLFYRKKTYAEFELDFLVKNCPSDDRPIVADFIPEILAMVRKLNKSGQSVSSAPFVAKAVCDTIYSLYLQQPILPVMGTDTEWVDVAQEDGKPLYQNARCSSVFKVGDGPAYYISAIAWKVDDDIAWTGVAHLPDGTKVSGTQLIKQFPFEPKKFLVDVEENKDGELYIKDPKQLDEVFSYYDKYAVAV